VTYISLCRHPIQISTVQSEEQHVVNNLPKFHLNRTGNELENAGLQKLRRLGKFVVPGGMKAAPGDTCSVKTRKTTFFVNRTPHLSPDDSSLPPGGAYSSGKIPDFSRTREEP